MRAPFRSCSLAGRVALAGCLLVAAATWAVAQSPRNVLLVVNESSPESLAVGDAYRQARDLDPADLVRVSVEPADEVSRADFERRIEGPIGQWILRNGAQDRILYIVLARGIPLRVQGTTGRSGTAASVDSELTLLYRKMTGRPVVNAGQIPNPYFRGDAKGEARSFTHEEQDIYLVTRLDGFTVADVKGLIDRGVAPRGAGSIVLDMKASLGDQGNVWLQAAADRLTELGLRDHVVLDTTSDVVAGRDDVLGYFGWGSNDPAVKSRRPALRFVPGAIGGQFVSTDARTFREPPDSWTLGSWDSQKSWYAGSPQSLTGDLVRAGVTGASGSVAEPFFDGLVRPDLLLPAYMAGFTLAESFYQATPFLSWQTVVVGDPLCAPISRARPATPLLEPPVDPDTDLPAFFSKRRVDVALTGQESLKVDGIKLSLKAETRLARDDRDAARALLEQAIVAEPRLTRAQMALAGMYEQAQDYDKAADRYRAVLGRDPVDAIALNNLAYIIGVRQKRPGDGLPYAERAYLVSRGNPTIADTVGWLCYLMGDKTRAARYLAEGLRGASANAEVRYHWAVLLLDSGKVAEALKELDQVLAQDASFAGREDFKATRSQAQAAAASKK